MSKCKFAEMPPPDPVYRDTPNLFRHEHEVHHESDLSSINGFVKLIRRFRWKGTWIPPQAPELIHERFVRNIQKLPSWWGLRNLLKLPPDQDPSMHISELLSINREHPDQTHETFPVPAERFLCRFPFDPQNEYHRIWNWDVLRAQLIEQYCKGEI